MMTGGYSNGASRIAGIYDFHLLCLGDPDRKEQPRRRIMPRLLNIAHSSLAPAERFKVSREMHPLRASKGR
jgi:hypothetical protein